MRLEHIAMAGQRVAARVKILSIVYSITSALLLAWAGIAPWRALVVAVAPLVMALVQRWLRAGRSGPAADPSFVAIALSWQLYIGTMLALTGGIHSPMIAGLAVVAVQPNLVFGMHRIGARLAVSIGVITGIVALLPASVTGPPITTWHHAALATLAFAWALFLVRQLITVTFDVQRESATEIDGLREERIREVEAHTRSLQAMSARLAHELKNPLAVIKALVQLQARRATGERERQQQDVMQSEIARMETLLREYLSFAKPFETLEASPTDLSRVVAEAARVASARAEHLGIEIVADIDAAPVVADARRIKHAVLNLLANALDATPKGGRVTVSCAAAPDGGARIAVSDTGRGIQAEDLARIGTSFFTTRAEGTGLGVVTIVRVVAQHGGRVHYASAPGRGTTVTLELPALASPRPAGAGALSTELAGSPVRREIGVSPCALPAS